MNIKINYSVLLVIILVSIFLSITYNYFSLQGIPLIAEEKKLQWASDSLFYSQNEVDIIKGDSSLLIDKESETDKNLILKKDSTKPAGINETKEKKTDLTEPTAINLEQAYQLYKQSATFIDAREPADYQSAHIKNAVSLPFDHFDKYKNILATIDKEETIVIYCAGTDCDLSILLGNLLFEDGYKNIYIFFGGWNEWTEAEYPVQNGNQTAE